MQLEKLAISAWHRLRPASVAPHTFELPAEENRETTVYRLVHDGQHDSAVIAKRCRQDTARIERTIYEEILPNLPLASVEYYGSVEEPNGEYWWLFLEDVSADEEYRPESEEHHTVAAQWLGIMNTSASELAAAACLPERGSRYYLNLLHTARDTIRSSVANAALKADDLALLEVILTHCEHLSACWSQLAYVCEGIPQTLVHGDFITKNVKVRKTRDGIILLPFDWEKAGWGIPAEDISRVDIATYSLTIQDRWPTLSIQALERLAIVGKVFRCIVFLDWIAPSLTHGSVERSLNDMKRCETWLAELIQAAGWQD
jgi:hypothetical protein